MTKKFLLFPAIFLITAFGFKFFYSNEVYAQSSSTPSPENTLEVKSEVLMEAPHRLGINLPDLSYWGPQKYTKDILMNPGLEGLIDRVIVFVDRSDGNSFSDEENPKYDDGTWNEAEFEIRTGQYAGYKGKVVRSLRTGADGLPQYFTEASMPPVQKRDVIVLSKVREEGEVKRWWIDAGKVFADATTTAPGSLGKLSARLEGNGNLSHYFETLASTAGKFIVVEGQWNLSFWAKADTPGASLEVRFLRHNGTAPFLQEYVTLTTDWKEYSFDFSAVDQGEGKTMQLIFRPQQSSGKIWIDDVFLGSLEGDPSTVFTDKFLDALKFLRPSFLRQPPHLGESFENIIAKPKERKMFGLRTGGDLSLKFDLSLEELFNLCDLTGSLPWLIVPTTFSDEEYFEYGKYLAENANTNRFSEVIVEFGNENWNWLFRPAGAAHYEPHGLLSDRAFDQITLGAGDRVNFRKLINGQQANPWLTFKFLDFSTKSDTMTVGGYYLWGLDAGLPEESALQLIFDNYPQGMTDIANEVINSRKKKFAIYESGLHTMKGSARAAERNRLVAGAASGAALAKKMLELIKLGANPVMVTNFAQYSVKTWETPDQTFLWGIFRDIGETGRARPTGLAMAMLNRAIAGSAHNVVPMESGSAVTDKMTALAFKASDMWTGAIISENNTATEVNLLFPDDGHPLPSSYLILDAISPFDTNEDAENVKIVEKALTVNGRNITVTVPAWGMVVVGSSKDTLAASGEPTTSGSTTEEETTSKTTGTSTGTTSTGTTGTTSTSTGTTSTYEQSTPNTTSTDTSTGTSTETSPTGAGTTQTNGGTTTTSEESSPSSSTSDQENVNDLQRRIQELEQKQENILKILKDLQNLLDSLSRAETGWN